MKELTNLRKPREKHFLETDGTVKAYMYDEDIHFLKEGEYCEIDNTIEEKEYYYENRENKFKVQFSKAKEKELYEIEDEDYYIRCSLLNPKLGSFFIEKDKNVLNMRNISEYLDAKYDIIGTKLKESLILKTYTDDDIEFKIETDADLSLENDRILGRKGDEVLFRMEVPFMVSNTKEYSNGVRYELDRQEGGYLLTLKLDHEWLRDQEFPVIIDPTISENSRNKTYDTFIYEGDTLVDRNKYNYLKIGVDENNKIYRSLIKFELPSLNPGSQIISASASLVSHTMDYVLVTPGIPNIEERETITVHEVTAPWSEETANWETMSDKFSAKIESYTQFFRCEKEMTGEPIYIPKVNSMDITNLVKRWYSGVQNNGIMVKFLNEVYNPECKEYYMISKDNELPDENNPKPFLTIRYRTQSGLLDYLSYNSFGLKNGTSYVNLYNGNVINIFNISKTIAGKFPISLELILNADEAIGNLLGKRWRFSLEEVLNLETIDGKEYICYLDSTSNSRYFYKVEEDLDDGTKKVYYKDEDGQNLKIEFLDNMYKLFDKEGNERHFVLVDSKYLLSKIVDVEKNEVNLTYDSSNRIIRVVDANDEKIDIAYSDSLISVFSSHDEAKITLNGDKVSKISTKSGETVLEYDEFNLISKIKDTDGLGIVFEYHSGVPHRIKKVSQLGLQSKLGKTLSYEYGYNTTKITDEKAHVYTYTFNDQGCTVGTTIMDKSGLLKNSYGFNERFIEAYGSNFNNKKSSETTLIKFSDTAVDRWSFDDESTLFAANGGELTDEVLRTGSCYKGQDSRSHGKVIVGLNGLFVDEDSISDVTISGYVKNSKPVTIEAFYFNSLRNVPMDTLIIPESDDFTRFSFISPKPIYGKQPVFIEFSSEDDYYLADFQVDVGKMASPFNIVKNPEFKDETLPGWEIYEGSIANKEVERVTLPNGEYALKINSKPDDTISATYPFNYAGKRGDVYNLSFWYKNEGVMENDTEFVGNAVNLQFWSTNELEGAGTLNAKLNLHDTEWQFFSESFVAESDYSNFNLNVLSMNEVNSLYITDIMLIKEMGQLNYSYDAEGNVVSMTDLAGNISQLTYDSKNQLIGAFTPKGNRFSYEYDNDITSRVLKGISPTGISNEIEYDSFGNPVKTIINNVNSDGKIVDGKDYQIRLKGTKKYIDYDFDLKEFTCKENDCSHKTFNLLKVDIFEDGTYYRLSFLNKYLSVIGEKITLQSTTNDSTLFILTKKNNGSYFLTPKTKQRDNLAIQDGKLVLKACDDEDYTQQFYFEDYGTDKFIESKTTYTDDGKYITSKTDSLGKTVYYEVDPVKGHTKSITDAKGNITNYTYNQKDQLTSVTNNEKTISYEYDMQDQLSKITSGTKNYTFTYDDFLNSETVKINGKTLITNLYEERDGNLLSSTYGNGDKVSYAYDEFDRLKSFTDSEKTYTNHYNSQGQLALVESDDETHRYYYDFANRLSEYVIDEVLEKFKENFKYDENGNVLSKRTQLVYTPGTVNNEIEHSSEVSYEYDENDSIIRVIFDEATLNYSYDYLGRLERKNISGLHDVEYKYVNLGKKTSLLVKSLKVGEDLYEYKYDDLYNITDIYLNEELMNHYEYDSLNELIQDDNYVQNITYRYSYDNEGNILSKKELTLGTDEIIKEDTFEYKNTSWEDQLTKYNDEEIEYDAIGNPIKIGNKTLTWTNGRQLKTLEQADRTINYFYNKDGIRVGKNSSGILCEYYLEGSNIVLEKRYTDMIYYIRDDVGSLIGMKYKDKMYYYIKNLQEDIIGIMDAGFNRVATYEYDAWGRILSIRDELGEEIKDEYHIARINPFRYRSYYYDEESGLYYLKSRYYNPVWGRFLNADSIIGTSEQSTGYNLYSYVENNPVNAVDSDGEFGIAIGYGATKVAEAVIGGVILGITYIASKKATETIVDVITNPPSLPDKKPKEKKEEKRNHTVYTLRDPVTDIYMYVGRTTNYKAREAAHRRNLARKNLIMEVVKDNLSYAAARGLEQIKINELKTLNKSNPANNQMNGVNPFIDNCKEYMQSGYRALYGETYVGGIEWCK